MNDCSANWKLGVSTSHGNLGFPVNMKLKVSNRLSFDVGMSSEQDLEIADFVDVVEDENKLTWERM